MESNQIKTKELKEFSAALACILLVIGGLNVWKGHVVTSYWFLCAAIVVVVIAFIRTEYMRPIFIVFSNIGKVIGWINARILLILIFYGIIMPIGFVIRLCGKDLLDRKIDKKRVSYWIDRANKNFDAKHYEKQF